MRRLLCVVTGALLLAGCQPVETAPGDPAPRVATPSWLQVELAYEASAMRATCDDLKARLEATAHDDVPVEPFQVSVSPDFEEIDATDDAVHYAVTCDAVAQYQVNAISAFSDRFTIPAGTLVVERP